MQNIIEGIVYKSVSGQPGIKSKVKNWQDFTSCSQVLDVQRQLAKITGLALDSPVIADIPYSNWTKTFYCDPIPAEIALPSDIRFREDLICLRRGEKGKGKVWK